ncbi:MAG TPA: gluconeogenesis factor YvcK family protein [Patescibacteria group bacterium]|nr:gluconeogenesis factor YvcK family protein [Patescibacteria group bacterium]
MKKIVTIGGGTGMYMLLSGLKKYDVELSVIVSMMDSGGSTGRLRDQLGVLPPGDVRQCLVALSEASDLWRQLFLYRFENGDLQGHNFGNIFISALEKIIPDYQKVIDTASFILKTKGQVIPVTHDNVHLSVQYEDGETIEKESAIDTATHKLDRIVNAFLIPRATANKKALTSLLDGDYIILGPGDLYTSLIANLLVDGVSEAIIQSSARVILIMNLMTKKGQTTHYTASDHIEDIEKYMKKKVDIVLMNEQKISDDMMNYYMKSDERQVQDDLQKMKNRYSFHYASLISNALHKQLKNDYAVRSLVRHDSEKLAEAIQNIITR